MIARTKRADYKAKWVPIGRPKPSPENEDLYGPIEHDQQMDDLIESIRANGLDSPLLLTADGFILSGHRRHYAAQQLGWPEIPVRVKRGIRREGNPEYHRILAAYNPQRVKTVGSLLREALLRDNDPADIYEAIKSRREAALSVDADFMEVEGEKEFPPISARRMEFLRAVQAVIEKLETYWPLSIRQIHYRLCNAPPLKQTPDRSKYDLEHYRYKNDQGSYDSLVDLLTPARYHGHIAWNCIDDATRPQRLFGGFDNVDQFVRQELDRFLVGYHRDRQRDQPRHVEVFLEKNTLYQIGERACSSYYVPFSIGRGFCSKPVWRDMEARFRASGKERMTLVIVSDHDPAGFYIADDAVRSLRAHHIPVDGMRIAVTRDQIDELGLAQDFNPIKEDGAKLAAYVDRTGDEKTWEVEALPPDYLVERIKAAIEANMDMEVFRNLCQQEREDCLELSQLRAQLAGQLDL